MEMTRSAQRCRRCCFFALHHRREEREASVLNVFQCPLVLWSGELVQGFGDKGVEPIRGGHEGGGSMCLNSRVNVVRNDEAINPTAVLQTPQGEWLARVGDRTGETTLHPTGWGRSLVPEEHHGYALAGVPSPTRRGFYDEGLDLTLVQCVRVPGRKGLR